jgi:hypothetical protein
VAEVRISEAAAEGAPAGFELRPTA